MKALTRLALGKTAYSVRAIEERARLPRAETLAELVAPLHRRAEEHASSQNQKRDLSLRANGTIDPWYGCFLFDEMVEYTINYTAPWSKSCMLCCSIFSPYTPPSRHSCGHQYLARLRRELRYDISEGDTVN